MATHSEGDKVDILAIAKSRGGAEKTSQTVVTSKGYQIDANIQPKEIEYE